MKEVRYFVEIFRDGDHENGRIIRLKCELADLGKKVTEMSKDICCYAAWDTSEEIVSWLACTHSKN